MTARRGRRVGCELGLGLAVGVMSGLFGVGGGTVAVPGLLLLGLTQHAAHATSLAAIVLTAAAALVPFSLDGSVHVPAGLALVSGALAGSYLGAGVMHRVPGEQLRIAFVLMVLLVSLRMLVGVEPQTGAAAALDLLGFAALVGFGLVTGLLSAVLGLGGGLVLVPALVLGFGFSQHLAEGTSLAVIVPTALLGAARHTRRGYTHWGTGLTLGIGGIVGGLGGAVLALALESLLLQRLFAVFLAAVAVYLLVHREAPGGGEAA